MWSIRKSKSSCFSTCSWLCLQYQRYHVVNIWKPVLIFFFFFYLPHQGLQLPQHPCPHKTLRPLTWTLTQYLATTSMLTTWMVQVGVVFLHTLPFGGQQNSCTLPPPKGLGHRLNVHWIMFKVPDPSGSGQNLIYVKSKQILNDHEIDVTLALLNH